jgi:phosphatidylglycerophosphate synthase
MIDTWLSNTKLKDSYERFVNKILLERISANQITLIGLVFGILTALFIYLSTKSVFALEFNIIACILMLVSFILDTMDGAIARAEGATQFGGVLDLFSDRTVEVLIIIAVVSTDPLSLIWPGLFSLGAMILCISMFLIVSILSEETEGTSGNKKIIRYRKGFMERAETLIFLFFIVLLFPWRLILLWLFAVLVFLTAVLRLKDGYKFFNK